LATPRGSTGQSAAAEIVPDGARLTFSHVPAVTVPDKALILPNGQWSQALGQGPGAPSADVAQVVLV